MQFPEHIAVCTAEKVVGVALRFAKDNHISIARPRVAQTPKQNPRRHLAMTPGLQAQCNARSDKHKEEEERKREDFRKLHAAVTQRWAFLRPQCVETFGFDAGSGAGVPSDTAGVVFAELLELLQRAQSGARSTGDTMQQDLSRIAKELCVMIQRATGEEEGWAGMPWADEYLKTVTYVSALQLPARLLIRSSLKPANERKLTRPSLPTAG